MSNQRLQFFISSKMQELGLERETIKSALAELQVESFVFEKDAGARPQSIQKTYLEEVNASDLYIGLFWKGYGAYTIEEFEHARMLGMDCMIYEKRNDIDGQRDAELQAFLDGISKVESGLTIRRFSTPEELSKFVKEDVVAWQAKKVKESQVRTNALYFNVPPMPDNFVGREDVISQAIRSINGDKSNSLAIEGMPGVGKTSIALAIVSHKGILRRFTDGVLWASLGQQASPSFVLNSWTNALQLDLSQYSNSRDKTKALRDAIGLKRFLLVFDDAWDYDVINQLRCGGPNCRYLVTTRDKEIAYKFAGQNATLLIESFSEDNGNSLLKLLAPEIVTTDPEGVRKLVRAVGGLPLAINLVGGYLSSHEHAMFADIFPDLSRQALQELMSPARRLKLAQDKLENSQNEMLTLESIIRLSLHKLPLQIANAFYGLAAFAPEPAIFTIEAAKEITGANDLALAKLASLNLIKLDKSRKIGLHPVVSDFATTGLPTEVIKRHRLYYLSLLQGDKKSLQHIFLDIDLFHQLNKAWTSCSDKADALGIFEVLYPYFFYHGLFEITIEWCERMLTLIHESSDAPLKARMMVRMSTAYNELHDWHKSVKFSEGALPLLENSGDKVGVGRVYANLSLYYGEIGDSETGRKFLQMAYDILNVHFDYYGVQQMWVTLLDFFKCRENKEGVRVAQNLLDELAEPEKKALVNEKSQTELSPIKVDSLARDRSSFTTCLPLLVLQYRLTENNNTTSKKTNILLGVQRKVLNKEVYYYTAIFCKVGQKAQMGKIIKLEDKLKKSPEWNVCALFTEEYLTELLLHTTTLDLAKIEIWGNIYDLTVLDELKIL